MSSPESRDTVSNYTRVNITEPSNYFNLEDLSVCKQLVEAIKLRDKYLFKPKNLYDKKTFPLDPPTKSEHEIVYNEKGQIEVRLGGKVLFKHPTLAEFHMDYNKIFRLCQNTSANGFCQRRLKINEAQFDLHILLNSRFEQRAQQYDSSDKFNLMRVDNHVHLASAMDSQSLLKFIKKKLERHPDDIVSVKNGVNITLKEAFDSVGIPIENLSVDTLDCHATLDTFHRFDHFNLKYNPAGSNELRNIFLKTENHMKGLYFAEITKELFDSFEQSKYITSEPRVSIYGRSRSEWTKVAEWAVDNSLFSPNVKWLIQIPRLFPLLKTVLKAVDRFQDLLDNIFLPLFEVTRDPSIDPKLHKFLSEVVGFDSVDDESKPELPLDSSCLIPPKDWTREDNPPYVYYNFHFYAYLTVLNQFRESRGLNTFAFRPHSGESGNPFTHLTCSFLLAETINHGIQLRKSCVLQYLFYLCQIGLAMSPLSNNYLFLEYSDNPFYMFFKRGLNVTLSTDDPLQFHHSDQALLEEYSVATQFWKLSSCDVCEIARNSVLQSGFDHEVKKLWIGENYHRKGVIANDMKKTNIPNIRTTFRFELLEYNLKFVQDLSLKKPQETFETTSELKQSMMTAPEVLSNIKIETEFIQPRSEVKLSSKQVNSAFQLRKKYSLDYYKTLDSAKLGNLRDIECVTENGVICLMNKRTQEKFSPPFTLKDYLDDFNWILGLCSNGPAKSFCYKRLTILSKTFQLHDLLNSRQESYALKNANRNFFKTHCVDQTNLSTATHPSVLFDYITKKAKGFPSQPVLEISNPNEPDKEILTLGEVYESSGFFNLPVLETHIYTISPSTFLPQQLHQVFLDIDNLNNGSYYGELAGRLFQGLDDKQYQRLEVRITLPCERRKGGWERLANWVVDHNLLHPTHVRWVVQLPAAFPSWVAQQETTTFQEFLDDIFLPLFESTLHPKRKLKLKLLLEHVTAFEFTADERFSERFLSLSWLPTSPSGWNHKDPPFGYYCYYLYANLFSLNSLRKALGLNTIAFRTECGRDGDNSINLAFSYLFSDGVYQGILLQKSPVLQYLYYLAQIPLYISPCIFHRNREHPFAHFFKIGLRTSIVTTGSSFNFTQQPLLEQLTIATRMWELKLCDLHEILYNSVVSSGFEHKLKCEMLGENYCQNSASEDFIETNLPYARYLYRKETLDGQLDFLRICSDDDTPVDSRPNSAR